MSSRLVLVVLLALGIVGFVLVVTADGDGPVLVETITAEGLVTEVPEGWQVDPNLRFDYRPPLEVDPSRFDRWTVARVCGPGGCQVRSLSEWMALADDLPTFVAAFEPDAPLEIIEEQRGDGFRAFTARTSAGALLVRVAAFTDGADHYVECGVDLGLAADQRLADRIVDVCRATERL